MQGAAGTQAPSGSKNGYLSTIFSTNLLIAKFFIL
jgi:hypothetical protein